MRRLLAGGLAWSLACLGAASAADNVSDSRAESNALLPALAISLGRPEPLPEPDPDDALPPTGIELGSPLPEPDAIATLPPTGIELTSFQSEVAPPPRVVRAKSADETGFGNPQPLNTVEPLKPVPATSGSSFAAGYPAAEQHSTLFATPGKPKLDCDGCDCDCYDCCVRMHRFYIRGEYLLWWIRNPSVPVLVTTGPVSSEGILGNPGTVVLFGGSKLNYEEFSGGRFTAGWWCDPCQHFGIEGSFFFLGQRSAKFVRASDGSQVLTRPFFNINDNREDSEITSAPNIAAGGISVDAPSRLWGAELNARCNLCSSCTWRIDWLTGFRYVELDEKIKISESVLVLTSGPNRTAGDSAIVVDEFNTRNQFYGGQVGFDIEWRKNRWVVDLRTKVALGDNHETIIIKGSQLVTFANGTQQAFNGGLLALPSNIGHFERDRFSVIPEVGLNLGYQITDNLLVFVGYNFLYWSNVVRPGDQIDRVLDINQIPNFRGTTNPPAPQVRPIVPFKEQSFWAQGMNVGLEYRY
jgi:hypothetical protein